MQSEAINYEIEMLFLPFTLISTKSCVTGNITFQNKVYFIIIFYYQIAILIISIAQSIESKTDSGFFKTG